MKHLLRIAIRSLYKIIGELESLGDSGEAISRILTRRNTHGREFDADHIAQILSLIELLSKAYDVMIANLRSYTITEQQLQQAVDVEIEINDLRNKLREREVLVVEQQGAAYQSSVYYLDVISELERMGDYIINISQAILRK